MEDLNDINYDNIVETLSKTFGNVLSRDCLYTIVESCGGDLDTSANAIINIVMDGNYASTNTTESAGEIQNENVAENPVRTNKQDISSNDIPNKSETNIPSTSSQNVAQHIKSYAGVSKTINKPGQKICNVKQKKKINDLQSIRTDQLKQILTYHTNGARILILMRGVTGSGKSYLAKKIIDVMFPEQQQRDYSAHIYSTDSYFMHVNKYEFDASKLSEYHEKNEKRARNSMIRGISPIIIDNTNIDFWEMKPYIGNGVRNGYIVEIVEPNTPWARNATQLYEKSVHEVPYNTIKKKLENFRGGYSGSYLIEYFKFHYLPHMTPPVLRLIPPYVPVMSESSLEIDKCIDENNESQMTNLEFKKDEITQNFQNPEISNQNVSMEIVQEDSLENDIPENIIINESAENENENIKMIELEKTLEEIEKIEKEWEEGDDWDEGQKFEKENENTNLASSKPPRKDMQRSSVKQKLLPPIAECEDWSKISMFLPSWGESSQIPAEIKAIVETNSSSTCIEIGDTVISDLKNPLKIITATSRDINKFYVEPKSNKIPAKWTLDKSTSTSNNQMMADTQRCENEEQHFNAFRKLFKNIPRSDLRDIFDNCHGDVNWAVDIVLDGVNNQHLGVGESDNISDTEEENTELCKCLSAYDIIPDCNEFTPLPVEREQKLEKASSFAPIKKAKKELELSEESMQVKRQIEQNVYISKRHYSDHCLKIRKMRYGDNNEDETDNNKIDALKNTEDFDSSIPSTSGLSEAGVTYDNDICANESDNAETKVEESAVTNNDPIIYFNVGSEFIEKLDERFGRDGMQYPPNVKPMLHIHESILYELNSLWIESLFQQIQDYTKQTEFMIRQDEEFARQLAIQESELIAQGKKLEVPDFKEVMAFEFAYSFYEKEMRKWRDKLPDDLAAKLTREKLYNLFPDILPDVLDEMLMAHENNFKLTVEVVLSTLGRTDILEEENGITKFVMQKEIERQTKIIQKEKQALSEIEWPLLPAMTKVDMATVQSYRDEADCHLRYRNESYKKAQEYIQRRMATAASFYSDCASFHTLKYEQANSLAAVSLIQYHAMNCPNLATIDLHYLRVAEARETLDLFLDTHIQKLRELRQNNVGLKSRTLFLITGRGRHSNGRPRVKPAVMKRLRDRGMPFTEHNPGLLAAKIHVEDKLSSEIS